MMQNSKSEDEEEVVGYSTVSDTRMSAFLCTECADTTNREVEEITESDLENFDKASCRLCGEVFYHAHDIRPMVDTSVDVEAIPHNVHDEETTIKVGDVDITTEATFKCACERPVMINTSKETVVCDCGREWSVR